LGGRLSGGGLYPSGRAAAREAPAAWLRPAGAAGDRLRDPRQRGPPPCHAGCNEEVTTTPRGLQRNTPQIQLYAYTEAPSSEDPAQEFIYPNANANSITVNLSSSFATPALYVVRLAQPFGGFLRLVLKGTMGNPAGTFRVSTSVDVVCRS